MSSDNSINSYDFLISMGDQGAKSFAAHILGFLQDDPASIHSCFRVSKLWNATFQSAKDTAAYKQNCLEISMRRVIRQITIENLSEIDSSVIEYLANHDIFLLKNLAGEYFAFRFYRISLPPEHFGAESFSSDPVDPESYRRHAQTSLDYLASIGDACSYIHTLNLENDWMTEEQFRAIFTLCPKLKKLEISHGRVYLPFLNNADTLEHLRELSISDSLDDFDEVPKDPDFEPVLGVFLKKYPQLESLTLMNLDVTGQALVCPGLKTLSLTCVSIQSSILLNLNFPHLQSLTLTYTTIDEDLLPEILRHFSHVHFLQLSDLYPSNPKALEEEHLPTGILTGAQIQGDWDLSNCTFPNLMELILPVGISDHTVLQMLEAAPLLRKLTLTQCTENTFRQLKGVFPNLRELHAHPCSPEEAQAALEKFPLLNDSSRENLEKFLNQ